MEAFNVGSERAISILEPAHTVSATLGRTANVQVGQEAIQGIPIQQYVPSTQKAQHELGLNAKLRSRMPSAEKLIGV